MAVSRAQAEPQDAIQQKLAQYFDFGLEDIYIQPLPGILNRLTDTVTSVDICTAFSQLRLYPKLTESSPLNAKILMKAIVNNICDIDNGRVTPACFDCSTSDLNPEL